MNIPSDPFYGLKYINNKEIKQVKKVMKSKGLFRFDGPKLLRKTEELEDKLSKKFEGNALCVDNGTSALKLCLVANEIGIGDEVLVPCLSFIASASCVLTVGALPVFVDIDESFNIDVSNAEKLVTKKTRAIIVVHFQGQAFGVKYNNQLVGTFGDCSAFSFQAGKIITSGEGGLFLCKDKAKFEKAKRYADSGGYRPYDSYPSWDKEYTSFGENFKITELQSAILLEQLKKIDKIYQKQQQNYKFLTENLPFCKIRPNKSSFVFPMSLCLMFSNEDESKRFLKYTNEKGIEFSSKIGNFLPSYNTFKNKISCFKDNVPYTKEYKVNDCLKSLQLIKNACWLNLSAYLKKRHLKYIIKVLKDFNYEKFYK